MLDLFQKTNKIKKTEIKPKTIKAGSFSRKQNKNISQNNKKVLKKWQQEDLLHLQNSICTIILIIILLFVSEQV